MVEMDSIAHKGNEFSHSTNVYTSGADTFSGEMRYTKTENKF